MNLIQKQATKFVSLKMNHGKPYQDFIRQVIHEIGQYSRVSHEIEFIETVMFEVKKEYEDHLPNCTDFENCPRNFFYESVVFFLNEHRQELSKELTTDDFNQADVLRFKTRIDDIIEKLNKLELGQQITYDDFSDEFEEMKSYFYMNKKSWQQMLAGKLVEMVSAGVISETVSKEIVQVLDL